MKSLIEQLRALNELDKRLHTIRRDLERMPRELAAQEDELRMQAEQIERRKAEVAKLMAEGEAADVELKVGEEALRRLATQMNNMRHVKEFETVRKQMDAQRGWNKANDEKVKGLLEQASQKEKEAGEIAAQLVEAQKVLAAEREQTDKALAELQSEADTLNAQRRQLAAAVPAEELATYDRIVVNRGQAIAVVSPIGVCEACQMKLPPQAHNLVLQARELITCPSCGRILTPP